jgi:hypothetical protein
MVLQGLSGPLVQLSGGRAESVLTNA